MFHYNINNNGDFESISHPHGQTSSLKHFLNPNSKQEDPLSYFFDHNFPSPFFQYEEDNVNFLLQHHDLLVNQQSSVAAAAAAAETVTNMVDSIHSVAKQIPRSRRSSKRDRHSKINTAQGPRDRRMRLSLEVARKFFDLQDMLGYDKASRTVEWLLRKSEAAIKEMARRFRGVSKSASSTSDCEVVSGIDEVAINQDPKRSLSKGKSLIKEKRIRQWRKAAFNPLARESREKARARARERTREKMLSRRLDESSQFDGSGNGDSNGLSSWSSFEVGEESAGTQLEIMAAKAEEPAATSTQKEEILGITQEMADDSFVIMDKFWSPSSIYNHLHNTGIPQEHQLQNFQFYWQTMGGLQQS